MNQKIPGLVPLCFVIALTSMFTAYANNPAAMKTEENKSAPIPMDQLGAVAGKQYQGDGLSVSATPDGARLRCAFQRLEGHLTREGLWLSSTADGSSGERFRVRAMEVGRVTPCAPLEDFGFDFINPLAPSLSPSDEKRVAESRVRKLPHSGLVNVADNVARFIRPGLTEEYSVSVDGVRQDFIVEQRPAGESELRVELEVTGAKAEPLVNGAQLVLNGSKRKLAYNRLHVVDAQGQELTARLEVTNTTRFAVIVDDSDAVYPVRIDPTFSDANWVSMGGVPGTDSVINATVVDASGNLYIGGELTAVENVIVNRIAKWNGSSWTALGGGLNGFVRALAISGNDVYVGGEFTTATNSEGTAVMVNRVAVWNGSNWSPLGGGVNNNALALAASGSDVYLGGDFTAATNSGGVAITVNRVAKWDGASWVALGAGMNGRVRAAAVSGSDMYLGGDFTIATNNGDVAVTVHRVAKWDGTSWSALGAGVNSSVYSLAVLGSEVFVGGLFATATNIGGVAVPASSIAKWNGSSWSALGTGMDGRVSALAVSGSDLYAGGYFTTAGGNLVNYIGKWNGSSWSTLGGGMGGNVYALAVGGTNVYAGGAFKIAGTNAANYIAKWNGSGWATFGTGMNNSVYALAVSDSNVYAGGYFTVAGGSLVNCIAKWNGNSWSPLGLGMNSNVQALAVSGTNLYAGGEFTRVTNSGGAAVTANRVARWNGSSWSALGQGFNGTVRALTVAGTGVHAGGDFTTANPTVVNRIARWNGSSWVALGSGVDSSVYALMTSGSDVNDVYAGGLFGWATNSGGVAVRVRAIAKWNESNWSALGPGLNGTVHALTVSGPDVYAGGLFTWTTNSGGAAVRVNYIAKWDGSSWSALGAGMNFWVYSLAASGSDVYAGGWFTRATNSGNITVPANYIAKWDGATWEAMGSGMGGGVSGFVSYVHSLAVSDTDLYAGGSFATAGGKVSGYAAKASFNAPVSPGLFDNMSYSPVTGFSCTFLDASIGQSYRIQTSPSLAAGSWTDFTNFTYTAPIVITDTSALSGTNKFFRAITP
jgi:hypothetical protein